MGEIIPLIHRAKSLAPALDPELVRTKVIAGEARLLGAVWFRGVSYACYQLEHDHHVRIVFRLRAREGPSQELRKETAERCTLTGQHSDPTIRA
ncbi:MAG: hypothetical protein ACM3ZC_09615 [Bacteroidota bacterium]